MISLLRGKGRLPLLALAVALGIEGGSRQSAVAGGLLDGFAHREQNDPGVGSLSYGGCGAYPGYSGFGLSFHRGYGYGGHALGTGAAGGYPYYGGPGYPHCTPSHEGCWGIAPISYYGGPGYPRFGLSNFYEMTGPLTPNPEVVTVVGGGFTSDANAFGAFTGALPYPESKFAPYASEPSQSDGRPYPPAPVLPDMDSTTAPAPSSTPSAPRVMRTRDFGITEEAVVAESGARAMKVAAVFPGSAADKAGLRAGDVIRSINGFGTEKPGNTAWILSNAAPRGVLTMSVVGGQDRKARTVVAQIP